MNNSIETSKNTNAQNISTTVSGVEVLGKTFDEFGNSLFVAKAHGANDYEAFTFDPVNLITGSSRELAKVLIGKGINSPIKHNPLEIQKDIIDQFELKKDKKIIFIKTPGTYQYPIEEEIYQVTVVNGTVLLPRPLPNDASVILVGEANKKHIKNNDYQIFIKEFSPIIACQPRLILMFSFAMASFWWPIFGIKTLALMLVGETSTGKSVSQRLVSQLINGSKKMISGNFTAIGLHDELANQGTQSVFIEDAHGKTVAQAMISAFMDAGNSAHRLRSKKSQYGKDPAKSVTATLIVSAEQGIAVSAKEANTPIYNGIFSRLYEIYPGEFGMFDDLCGFSDGASLAAYFDQVGEEYSGILGELVTQSICKDLPLYQEKWLNRQSIIAQHIRKYIKVDVEWDGQDSRLFHSLVFCAFIAQQAAKNNYLIIKNKDINSAFGKLFGEHLTRKNYSSIKKSIEIKSTINAVKNAISLNIKKIKNLDDEANYSIQLKKSSIIGFQAKEKDGIYYLIEPQYFKKIMGKRSNLQTYKHLKEAGYLKVSKGRGYKYQKRLPNKDVVTFVAISADIISE